MSPSGFLVEPETTLPPMALGPKGEEGPPWGWRNHKLLSLGPTRNYPH